MCITIEKEYIHIYIFIYLTKYTHTCNIPITMHDAVSLANRNQVILKTYCLNLFNSVVRDRLGQPSKIIL